MSSQARHARAAASRAPAPAGETLTKQEQVYRVLRERILDGTCGPGSRIVIDGLAAELGVSALPIREAVRRLEAEGLVVFRPNAGPYVTPGNPDEFDERLTVLAVLDGYATALASPHVRAEDLARLTELSDAMQAAMEHRDAVEFGRLNSEFHAVIYARCPNAALVEMAQDVSRRLAAIRRAAFAQIPYRWADSIREHRRLVELLRDGAPHAEIEAVARAHKLATAEAFRQWHGTHADAPHQ